MSVLKHSVTRGLSLGKTLSLSPKLLLVVILTTLVAGLAQAQSSVTLAWSPSADSTVVGYRLYQGGASQSYTNIVDVGAATTYTVTGLAAGATYFFAVTAYDATGLESPFSNEISYTVPPSTSPVSVISFAASSGTITSPFTVNGGLLSQSVTTGVTGGGRAAYSFTITNAGTYAVSAMVAAPSETANSFYVNIDAEPTAPAMTWDIHPLTTTLAPRTVTWRGNGTDTAPQHVPAVFNLSAGTHQLVVRGAEANTQLGNITVTPFLQITNWLTLAGGTRSIRGLGVANARYVLQASTDMAGSAWVAVSTNTSDALGNFSCSDSTGTNYTRRFYRVMVQ